MKAILCLAALAALLATGCRTHPYDSYRGGYYGPTEFERGEYRSHPEYWDGRDLRTYDRYPLP